MKTVTKIIRGLDHDFSVSTKIMRLTLFLILCGTGIINAQTVTSLSALQTAINNASPGDVITLANGTYTASTDITISKQGTASAPITIQAQTIGGATIGGTAGFNVISPAKYIIIKGFRFTHSASNATMASGTSFCRWTRNFFDTPGSGEYLQINGNDHEIDYNTFQNKEDPGKFITVRGTGSGSSSQIAERLKIHHNYFKTHLPGGGNGNETIQFGLSGYSLSNSNSTIEYNLFEDCNGENEGISVKASMLTIRYNTFRNNPAQFTLRHGNKSQIYGNYFINTPGLRIFGDDHKVFSNHFENCSIALDIGNGDGEVADGAPLTSHDRPDRVLIAFNTLVNNTSNFHQGGRTDGLGATFITVANNIAQGGGAAADIAGPYTNPTWSGNIIFNTAGDGDMPTSGYRTVDPQLFRDATGTFHLQAGSPAIGTATGSYPSVVVDMDGQARTSPLDVGADEVSNATVIAQILTPSMVGQNGSTTSAPSAPSGLTATAVSSSQINLNWVDNSNNESNFSIERSTNGGSTWSVLTTVGANATTFSNTGLTPNTTYHYRVRATNSGGNSGYSNIANATTQGVPIAPTYQAENAEISQGVVESNHVGFNGTGFVNFDNVVGSYVEWDINVASSGTYNLAIRYANASGADRPMSITVNGTVVLASLSFPPTALWTDYVTVAFSASLNAGVNTVRATATTAVGGPNADELQVNGLQVSPPAAPSGLTATTVSSSQINLSWTDNSNNEANFRIERSTDAGATWSFLVNPAANATTFSNTGLTASTTYHYRVRAENTGGNSSFSNTANATTLPTAPAAPSGLTATAISSSQINLTWTDNSNNEANFRIERSTDAGSTWAFLVDANANAINYSNTGLTALTTYHYRVRAENAGGNSSFSNIANATTNSGSTLQNVALNKPVTASGSDTNIPANAVDGDNLTRWSASPMPQWLEVDLGAVFDISKTEVICYLDRAYQFIVEAKTTSGGTYSQVVNRSTNTTPGTIAAPITNTFPAVNARFVKITVTGASGYTGTWASIVEFRVFGVPATAPCDPAIASADDGNVATNVLDNNLATRWSASGDPQWIQFCLSTPSSVSGVQIAFYKGDERQSIFDVLVSSDASAWTTAATGLRSSGTSLNLETFTFTPVSGKYVRIVGHGNSLNLWNSYTEVKITASSSSSRVATSDTATPEPMLSSYPNPAFEKTTVTYEVQKAGPVRLSLYNTGNYQTQTLVEGFMPAGIHQTVVDTKNLPRGVHIIRLLSNNKLVIHKLLKQ